MQLRLALSVPKFTESLFKQSTSAILTGVTIAGAFSTVIFNSTNARSRVNEAFSTFASLLQNSSFGSGVIKLGSTFKDWGTFLVSKKDDFAQWVRDYVNPSGLKSGAVELYKKLYAWATIVYEWFRDKFIKFIENIPDMVKNWKKLRLSLFKWGTFLGGGGGSALWAMFGSGDNWDKFGELLGNPEFGDLVDKFSTLLEKNGDAFADMTEEEAKEMLEAMMDDPAEAKELVDELLKEQEKKNEEKKKELEKENKEQEQEEQLTKNEILEKLKNSGGGSPKDPTEAFGHMVSKTLQGLVDLPASSLDKAFEAKKKINAYLDTLKKEVKEKARKAEVKEEFLKTIEENEKEFVNFFAETARQAYDAISGKPVSYSELASKFAKILEGKVTVVDEKAEGQGVDIAKHIPTAPVK